MGYSTAQCSQVLSYITGFLPRAPQLSTTFWVVSCAFGVDFCFVLWWSIVRYNMAVESLSFIGASGIFVFHVTSTVILNGMVRYTYRGGEGQEYDR